ncbi:hypothetical protein BCR42DRAFT_405380 [Absidia repens]|uniref:Uncharacterized protein n=1 Tax=Absidia repens TaxID=90262 RepID=A0A1X2ITC6_9FUNG|nr:hypothetical protein BCR42DRAFT_405380 [Absidia repens]
MISFRLVGFVTTENSLGPKKMGEKNFFFGRQGCYKAYVLFLFSFSLLCHWILALKKVNYILQ